MSASIFRADIDGAPTECMWCAFNEPWATATIAMHSDHRSGTESYLCDACAITLIKALGAFLGMGDTKQARANRSEIKRFFR